MFCDYDDCNYAWECLESEEGQGSAPILKIMGWIILGCVHSISARARVCVRARIRARAHVCVHAHECDYVQLRVHFVHVRACVLHACAASASYTWQFAGC